jgi:hypothetical protein
MSECIPKILEKIQQQINALNMCLKLLDKLGVTGCTGLYILKQYINLVSLERCTISNTEFNYKMVGEVTVTLDNKQIMCDLQKSLDRNANIQKINCYNNNIAKLKTELCNLEGATGLTGDKKTKVNSFKMYVTNICIPELKKAVEDTGFPGCNDSGLTGTLSIIDEIDNKIKGLDDLSNINQNIGQMVNDINRVFQECTSRGGGNSTACYSGCIKFDAENIIFSGEDIKKVVGVLGSKCINRLNICNKNSAQFIVFGDFDYNNNDVKLFFQMIPFNGNDINIEYEVTMSFNLCITTKI